MPLTVETLRFEQPETLRKMVANYARAASNARNDEAAARSRAEGYEADLVAIEAAVAMLDTTPQDEIR